MQHHQSSRWCKTYFFVSFQNLGDLALQHNAAKQEEPYKSLRFSSFPYLVFVSALQDPSSLKTAFKSDSGAFRLSLFNSECDPSFCLPIKYSGGTQESQLSQL